MAILIWFAIYPTANLIFILFGERIDPLPVYLKTLVLTLILVPTMVFVLLPLLQRIFKNWLMK
jgi:antibiotic biosynthesis monooxygenase (ABM) superfamily enzyme